MGIKAIVEGMYVEDRYRSEFRVEVFDKYRIALIIMSRDKYIPYELIINILSRLPCKSLVRFQCVCKSWYFLIHQDPGFQTIHHRLHNSNNTNNCWISVLSITSPQQQVYQVIDESFTCTKLDRCPDRCPNKIDKRGHCFVHVGSCKGLICYICDYHYKDIDKNNLIIKYTISMWNPSTRTHKMLDLSITADNINVPRVAYHTMFGVGFSNKDSDYKLVAVTTYQNVNEHIHHYNYIHLYSLRTNSWSEIKALPDSWRHWRSKSFSKVGTYFNGVCHWPCNIEDTGKILCFDFDYESIRLMDIPTKSQDCEGCRFFVHKDMLALWDCNNIPDSVYSFWVMKEYGNSKSWTSLFQVQRENFINTYNPRLGVYGTTTNGRLLLYRSRLGNLMGYDPDTELSKNLQKITYVLQLTKYQECLIFL